MKKVLALVVAFALCITAVAGCFSVSATAPVISIETADTSFTVSGTNYTAKIAQITELTVQNGLAVLSIYDGETELVKYDEAKQNDDDRTNDEFDWVESTVEGNTVIKFINVIEAGKSFAYTVNVDVDNAAYGDYKITATVEAGDYEAGEIVEVKSAEATFTKKAPHVCTPGEPVKENEVAADCVNAGSYDTVVYCSVCNAEISRDTTTVEAKGHAYGTPVDNGDGTHTATCANDANHTVTEDHDFSNGDCVCGKEKEVQCKELALGFSIQLSLGSKTEIVYNFRNKEGLSDSARVYAVVTKERYADDAETDSMETIIELNDKLNPSTNQYTFYYDGLAAKEMGKTVYTMIYGEDAEGNIIFKRNSVHEYSVITYATTANVGFNSSKSETRECMADMLNYGAAAQKYFSYNTGDLVNMRTGIDTLVEQYDTDEDLTLTSISGVADDEFSANFNLTNQLSLNSSIDFVANVNPTRLSSYDLNDIKVVFKWYNTKTGQEQECVVYGNDPDNFVGGSVYSFYCRKMAAAQVSAEVTIAVYNGNTQISRTKIYSIESYCCEKETDLNRNNAALAQALMKYGKSAASSLGY